MHAGMTLHGPYQPLLDWLARQGVEFEIHQHDRAVTARATAAVEGVDPRTFAKVVGVASRDGPDALIVLDATDQLDLQKAREVLRSSDVRLLSERELAEIIPDCEVGAMPPVGALFGLPTYADYALRDDPEISFNAGSHRYSARVDRATWERAAAVVYGDLVDHADAGPAWARS